MFSNIVQLSLLGSGGRHREDRAGGGEGEGGGGRRQEEGHQGEVNPPTPSTYPIPSLLCDQFMPGVSKKFLIISR